MHAAAESCGRCKSLAPSTNSAVPALADAPRCVMRDPLLERKTIIILRQEYEMIVSPASCSTHSFD